MGDHVFALSRDSDLIAHGWIHGVQSRMLIARDGWADIW